MTTSALGRGAKGALRVAVYWRERLIDVRPLEDSERGYARPGAEFHDGGLSFKVAALGDVERVPRAWPRRADLPFLLLVGGLLLAFGFSATLAVDAEFDHDNEPLLARAASTMSRTVFHLPPRVPQMQAHPRAATDDKEQVRAQPRRSDHRPLKAAKAGMLGALDALGGSPVFERTGLHERINASLDRLSGAPTADAQGFSGINARHGGSGGPGGNLSLGGIGSSPRPANGNALFAITGKKVETDPDPKRTIIEGEGLPRDVVAKVISRHLSQIRYCYESALQRAPSLAGKVAVLFTIDAAGNVSQADVAESSLGSSEVERCMVSRIQRWKFPEPKGGGVVSVSYPWVFKQAGTAEE